jgi:hypothetical protein
MDKPATVPPPKPFAINIDPSDGETWVHLGGCNGTPDPGAALRFATVEEAQGWIDLPEHLGTIAPFARVVDLDQLAAELDVSIAITTRGLRAQGYAPESPLAELVERVVGEFDDVKAIVLSLTMRDPWEAARRLAEFGATVIDRLVPELQP